MKKNEIIQLDITDIGVGGEGIGKLDGFPFFVKNAVIGDSVEAVVTKANKKYGFAKMLRLLKASPFRVEPACPKALQCGGCQIMQLDYRKQLEFKENLVKNNLIRIGGLQFESPQKKEGSLTAEEESEKMPLPVFLPIIGMDEEDGKQPLHFRNKVQFPVGRSKDGRIVAGFYAGRTHYIIETESCPVACEDNDRIIREICAFMEEFGIDPYEEKTAEGLVRHILIRNGFKTGQIMVCLVVNGETLRCAKKKKLSETVEQLFVERLLALPLSGGKIVSIQLNINKKKTNVILGDKVITLYGQPYIEDVIRAGQQDMKDLKFRISALSFYQVNPIQTEKLYSTALAFADLSGSESVWDLYCGTGTISLFLAQKARQVFGVEIVPDAIEDAKRNAQINGIDNVQFYCGDSAAVFAQKMAEQHDKKMTTGSKKRPGDQSVEVVVLDPPRKGCDAQLLETVMRVGPEKIVYVSCDPATLARDVKILTGNADASDRVAVSDDAAFYRVEKVQAVDMFPHTCHVECACLLSNKNAKPKEYIEIGVDAEDYYRIKDTERL